MAAQKRLPKKLESELHKRIGKKKTDDLVKQLRKMARAGKSPDHIVEWVKLNVPEAIHPLIVFAFSPGVTPVFDVDVPQRR